MKNTRKILVALLVLMTLMVSVFAVTASAAAGETWIVAGSQALCGSNWSVTDTNNQMSYDSATDSYVKVYENVKAGNYEFKCAKNKSWNTAYPSSNKQVKVEKDGSTVTITLKGTSVTVKVDAPSCNHIYEITAETVTCLKAGTRTWTCTVCKESYTENLSALGHHYGEDGKCEKCDVTTTVVKVYVDNAANWADVYCYAWDVDPYVAWPGEIMQKGADGLYYYIVPTSCPNIIFNNGTGTQSADLKTPIDRNVIYNNSTKAWSAPAQEPDHEHKFADATCTLPKKCECGEIEGEPLGHSFDANGVCTVCSYEPVYIIAGDVMKDETENYKEGTNFLGTIWDSSNANNKLSYNIETGLYTKTYDNVVKGEYHIKVVNGGTWYGNSEGQNVYIAANNAKNIVTISFNPKTNAISTTVEAACVHEYMFACDAHCAICGELTNADAAHNIVHQEAVAATCQVSGNVEFWYCSYCNTCWLDEACQQQVAYMSTKTVGEHEFVDGKCTVCGESDPNYVPPHEHVFVDGKCECGEEDPNYVPPHEHVFVDGKCECGEEDPNYVPPHEHVFVDGKCECGEEDPNYVPPVDDPADDPVDDPADDPADEPAEEPAEELNFFEKIWKAILDFFKKLFGIKE